MCSDAGTRIRPVPNGIFPGPWGPFKPSLSSLDGAEHMIAMLDTAGELDREPAATDAAHADGCLEWFGGSDLSTCPTTTGAM
jgi:hypothetical protein